MILAWLAASSLGASEVPVGTGTPVVDGVIDDPAWDAATPVSDFLRFQPTDGGAPPGTTEVWFLQDEKNLYVGIRVRGADYRIRARVAPREDINEDDQIGLYLDTFGDGSGGYVFYLNPIGVQQDILAGSQGDWNFSWDTVFSSEGHVTPDGYELEIAFPFRSLKFPSGGKPQDWGVMITRKIPAEGAKYGFPQMVRNHPRPFSQAAPLHLVPPKRGSGMELVPGLTVIEQGGRDAVGDDFAWDGVDPWWRTARPSLDARFGLTPSIGLTATINPDFSQVENDETPFALNQRYAFYFPEKRPFFLDGSDHFADLADTLYTRSIVEPIYGIKTFGHAGAWSVGALHALDQSPSASVNDAGSPGFADDDLKDALALDTVARVSHTVGDGGYAGLIVADKEILGTDGLKGNHRLLGLDSSIPLSDRWTMFAGAQGARTAADDSGTDGL